MGDSTLTRETIVEAARAAAKDFEGTLSRPGAFLNRGPTVDLPPSD
jgi:hypothetical protein